MQDTLDVGQGPYSSAVMLSGYSTISANWADLRFEKTNKSIWIPHPLLKILNGFCNKTQFPTCSNTYEKYLFVDLIKEPQNIT